MSRVLTTWSTRTLYTEISSPVLDIVQGLFFWEQLSTWTQIYFVPPFWRLTSLSWAEHSICLIFCFTISWRAHLLICLHKVPFLDVCNTLLDDNLPLTILDYEEFGNPRIKSHFKCILSYSPYDNISQGSCYPSMLVTASLNDTRQISFPWFLGHFLLTSKNASRHLCFARIQIALRYDLCSYSFLFFFINIGSWCFFSGLVFGKPQNGWPKSERQRVPLVHLRLYWRRTWTEAILAKAADSDNARKLLMIMLFY